MAVSGKSIPWVGSQNPGILGNFTFIGSDGNVRRLSVPLPAVTRVRIPLGSQARPETQGFPVFCVNGHDLRSTLSQQLLFMLSGNQRQHAALIWCPVHVELSHNSQQKTPRNHNGCGAFCCPVTLSVPAGSVLGMEDLVVETTLCGHPMSFVRDGRRWHVDPKVGWQRWYERTRWWETETRMPKEGGRRIDVLVWRVQARLGHNPRNQLVTFELVLGQDRETWTERSMNTIAA